jgi:hypothetical protein
MSKHNQAQIHVRNTSGKFRPGTTTHPSEAETNNLSSNEQTYLARGSNPQTPAADPNALAPGLEVVDIVEVINGSTHTHEGDSTDPSS